MVQRSHNRRIHIRGRALIGILLFSTACDPEFENLDERGEEDVLKETSDEPDGNVGIVGEPATNLSDPPLSLYPSGCVQAQTQALASNVAGIKSLLGVCDDATNGSQPRLLLGGCDAADFALPSIRLLEAYPGLSSGNDAWRCKWFSDGPGSAFTIEARMICCP